MDKNLQDEPLLLHPLVPSLDPGKSDRCWQFNQVVFRADYDSGNLLSVSQGSGTNEYFLWTKRDCQGSSHENGNRSWFHFAISGHPQGHFLKLTIMNLNRQSRLYSYDYRPFFWTVRMPEWVPVGSRVSYEKMGDNFQLSFCHKMHSDEETFFAFCIPFSYSEVQELLGRVDRFLSQKHDYENETQRRFEYNCRSPASTNNIYYKRQLLTRSVCGRRIDILTITDSMGIDDVHEPCWEPTLEGCYLEADAEGPCRFFPGRKVFFISARVHPGETPASHMFNGMLAFLLRTNDARAAALRHKYVFKLVPVLNPDGVACGHYRTDTLGQNLNRHYSNPDPVKQPSVWAVKQLLMSYANMNLLDFYLDLHAHANKHGVFTYGNTLSGEAHVETLVYSKLVAMNSPIFDFFSCNFTEKNMGRLDKDGSSKEGAGRVALYRDTQVTHIYTVEASYNCSRMTNRVSPCSSVPQGRSVSPPCSGMRSSVRFTTPCWQSVGRALLTAALDLHNCNPWSRLPGSEQKSVEHVRAWVVQCLKARSSHSGSLSRSNSQKSGVTLRKSKTLGAVVYSEPEGCDTAYSSTADSGSKVVAVKLVKAAAAMQAECDSQRGGGDDQDGVGAVIACKQAGGQQLQLSKVSIRSIASMLHHLRKEHIMDVKLGNTSHREICPPRDTFVDLTSSSDSPSTRTDNSPLTPPPTASPNFTASNASVQTLRTAPCSDRPWLSGHGSQASHCTWQWQRQSPHKIWNSTTVGTTPFFGSTKHTKHSPYSTGLPAKKRSQFPSSRVQGSSNKSAAGGSTLPDSGGGLSHRVSDAGSGSWSGVRLSPTKHNSESPHLSPQRSSGLLSPTSSHRPYTQLAERGQKPHGLDHVQSAIRTIRTAPVLASLTSALWHGTNLPNSEAQSLSPSATVTTFPALPPSSFSASTRASATAALNTRTSQSQSAGNNGPLQPNWSTQQLVAVMSRSISNVSDQQIGADTAGTGL